MAKRKLLLLIEVHSYETHRLIDLSVAEQVSAGAPGAQRSNPFPVPTIQTPQPTPLSRLIDALNEPYQLTESDLLRAKFKWYGTRKLSLEEKHSFIKSHAADRAKNLSELYALRPHLIELLAPITELPQKGTTRTKQLSTQNRRFESMHKLTLAINSQQLRVDFHPSREPKPNRAIHVWQDFYPSNTTSSSMVGAIYSDLANALVSGELERLRRCPYCQKFFAALKDRRTRFCPGTDHMRRYYDDSGEATLRKKNWRYQRWKKEQGH